MLPLLFCKLKKTCVGIYITEEENRTPLVRMFVIRTFKANTETVCLPSDALGFQCSADAAEASHHSPALLFTSVKRQKKMIRGHMLPPTETIDWRAIVKYMSSVAIARMTVKPTAGFYMRYESNLSWLSISTLYCFVMK